jgi:hypothetical protein
MSPDGINFSLLAGNILPFFIALFIFGDHPIQALQKPQKNIRLWNIRCPAAGKSNWESLLLSGSC